MRFLAVILALLLSASPVLADVSVGNGNVPIPVPATQGGTGLTTFTTNCVVAATNSSTLNCTTTPTLTGTNFTGVPFSGVTGTVPCNQGGTGQTSYAVGDIPYASASCTISKLAAVASGSVLASNGVTAAPIYTSAPAISGANITAASIPDSALNANIPAQTCTTWTPTDTSGASLSLTVGVARYCKTGKNVFVQFSVTYPTTVSAAAAQISIPITDVGVNTSLGVCGDTDITTPVSVLLAGGNFLFLTTASSTQKTNATMSTHNVVCAGTYESST